MTSTFLQRRCCIPLLAAVLALSSTAATAHSFNVALLVPLSGADASAGSQMRDGFMLATRERDSHAGQESDGHLGGLDVYVSFSDSLSLTADGIGNMLEGRKIDILAAAVPDDAFERISALAQDADAAVVRIARNMQPQAGSAGGKPPSAVAVFVKAFQADYGYAPTPSAAQGYLAARRIDQAVRAQAGIEDKSALAERLRQSESEFTW